MTPYPFGEPEDVDEECGARLAIADNMGDMCCQLIPDHSGLHKEIYNAFGDNQVIVQWEKDAAPPRMFKCEDCSHTIGPVRYGGKCQNKECIGWYREVKI